MNRIKSFISSVLVIALFVSAIWLYIDFIRFPECYIPTWKYQLECEIKRGDAEAIDYYNRCYVAHGRELFD